MIPNKPMQNSSSSGLAYNPEAAQPDTIIFAYALPAGLRGRIRHWFRGISNPQNPPCKLYALTHTTWGMAREWREFYRLIPLPKQEIYQGQTITLSSPYSSSTPCIMLRSGANLSEVVSSEEIEALQTIAELRQILIARLDLASDFELLSINLN